MIRTIRSLLPPSHRHRITGYTTLTITSVILRAASIVLLVPLVAALFSPTTTDAIGWVTALTIITIASWIIDAKTAQIGYDLGFATLNSAQHNIANRLTEIPLNWFTQENTPQARQAIAATGPELVSIFGYLLSPLTQAILLPVAIGIALLPIAWPLGIAALAGVPILLGALLASVRISRRADNAAADANSALTERIVEFARTQQTLRAARRVEPAHSYAGAAIQAQHGATTRLLLLQIPGQILFSIASQFALILLAGTTTLLAVQGTIGVPEAVALIVVIARYLEPFTAIAGLAPAIESVRTTLGRIRSVLDTPTTTTATNHTSDEPAKSSVDIEFRNVTFSYNETDEPVLDELNVTFEAGQTTAIVGPSGSGKSTILALIARLYEPTSGTVHADGINISHLDDKHARQLTSVVFQHPYLFEGTIRNNVLAGNSKADENQLTQALNLAQVDKLAARLPDGLDTTVGEAGTALSGGERQRVSIARALLKTAPVLLVDEATSALDAENETAIVAAINSDVTRRTRVVVAHRLSTIRGADRVLFLEKGRIIEDGTIEALLAENGRFAEFWRQQHDAARWQLTAAENA